MRPWTSVCLLLATGSLLVSLAAGAHPGLALAVDRWLGWHNETWVLRPWTLWTAAWVPAAAGSVAGNLLALLGLAVVGGSLAAGRRCAIALLVAWPLGTLALLLWPQVRGYGGLAGPIHAAAMVLWSHLALRAGLKPLSLVLVAAVGLKLLAERAWLQPVTFDPGWGGNVVQAAHLTGACAGALCGWVAQLGPMLRGLRAQAPAGGNGEQVSQAPGGSAGPGKSWNSR
ncbi:MAG TPA: hypothetical protein VLJ58_02775 [Ramlibacter sp.]|nr:hypothetical protein [Ramlibacter sp.]